MTAVPLPHPHANVMDMGGRAAPGGSSTSPFRPAPPTGTSVIGTDLTILGQNIAIISKNQLQIDGDVRGDVHGSQVTISAEGSVIGTVAAERIEVHGGVKGAIRAATVIVHPTAEVDAEIVHQMLTVAEGSVVQGSLRRAKDPGELIPNLDPNSYAGPRAS